MSWRYAAICGSTTATEACASSNTPRDATGPARLRALMQARSSQTTYGEVMVEAGRDEHIGRPCFELEVGLVVQTLAVVRAAAGAMVLAGRGLHGMGERQLNDTLRLHLVQEARRHTPPIRVEAEPAVFGDEVGGEYSAQRTGAPDFRFVFGESWADPARYLAMECKKVSGLRAGGHAAAYVDEGVRRFVAAKYARGHAWALMAAYVFEGSAGRAVEFVQASMSSKAMDVALQCSLAPADDVTDSSDVYSSRHSQAQTGVQIRLLHFLFELTPVCPPAPHQGRASLPIGLQ